MPDRLSDEDVSHQILGIFMRYRIPATGALQRNYFFDVRDSDFQRGINKAVANNWITIDLRNRYRYHLTTTGYAVGQTIDRAL
ncbi:MAG: hypothetical protein WA796_14710 [Pseudolabrys sp.]|jgi:hypothetical protein